MALTTTQRAELALRFTAQIQMSADRVLELHDHIQQRNNRRPDLTHLCKFGRSMQVRRLKSVATRHWNQADWSNAQAVLDEVVTLEAQGPGVENVLALAVLGVESDALTEAMSALERDLADVEDNGPAKDTVENADEAPEQPVN